MSSDAKPVSVQPQAAPAMAPLSPPRYNPYDRELSGQAPLSNVSLFPDTRSSPRPEQHPRQEGTPPSQSRHDHNQSSEGAHKHSHSQQQGRGRDQSRHDRSNPHAPMNGHGQYPPDYRHHQQQQHQPQQQQQMYQDVDSDDEDNAKGRPSWFCWSWCGHAMKGCGAVMAGCCLCCSVCNC